LPTLAPTSRPSSEPTASPTAMPTSGPTPSPTRRDTTASTSTTLMALPCKRWCQRHESGWTEVCKWKKHCAGCEECSARLLAGIADGGDSVLV
jgi:hypothetical protein